ncbi:large ribosomal subunit assembling factor, putative [Plasmodium reichenowi]|uniref:Large ribosomal subunit assembling factor, putative n=1 Tax=Plasmodium reichenowi TaxID=5854 RepID=A0A060RQT8_PLARE|nr:large ribosomal subunit assembling factor, putative [Plasmodium reichenowi]
MNEQKLKKQKFLNNLQHNICKNYKLYHSDFYDEFDKFLFNYSVVLLNPFKKNDLLCSQLNFLCFTCHYFSDLKEIKQELEKEEEEGEGGKGANKNMFTSEYDFEFSDIETDDDIKSENNKSDDFNDIEKKDMLNDAKVERDTYDEYNELLNINLELKKKEICNNINNEKNIKDIEEEEEKKIQNKKDTKDPLNKYHDLNEYINFLMIKNKEKINFVEELFFLVTQLVIHFKHNLYNSVLLSIIKTLRQIRKYVDSIKYLQVFIFLSDIKINKIKCYIFKCVMDKIIFIHKNKKVNKIKNHIQNNNSVTNKNNKDLKNDILYLLHEAFIECGQKKRIRKKYSSSNFSYFNNITINETINNFSCSVLIELMKKNIFVNKINVNLISEGIFYKNLKIVKCVCYALLGKYDNKELVVKIEKQKIDKNKKIEELKNISNQTHQKLTKSKIKQLHIKKEKIMEEIYNNHNSSSDDEKELIGTTKKKNRKKKIDLSNYVNYTFIDFLFDAYTYSSNIFNLICSKYQFNNGTIKLLLLNILCRIYQRNKIIEENFFLYYENVLLHLKNKNTISKYLSIFIQCLHDYIPTPFIQRIVCVLIKKFLCEHLSEEFVYLIINSIIEIIIKFPNCLNQEIFEAVIVFKDYKNKQISTIIRRFINICKHVNPQVLHKKFLDKQTAILVQKKKILNKSGESVQENSLLQYSYLLGKVGTEKKKKKNNKREKGENNLVDGNMNGNETSDDDINGKEISDDDINGKEISDDDINDEEISDDDINDEEISDDDINDEEISDDDINDDDINDKEISDDDINDDDINDDNINDDNNNDDDVDRKRKNNEIETNDNNKDNTLLHLNKKFKKEKRKEEKIKKELDIVEKNKKILCERILTDEDFKKLKKMRDYIANNKTVVLSELQDICNAEESDEDSSDNSSDSDKEKIITEEDLLYKKKLKKSQLMKIKTNKSENNRFKTNREKEKKKSVMMLIQKFKGKKKKNALTEYGKLKKKLKGKLAARAKKKGILQKRIAKKLSRRKR